MTTSKKNNKEYSIILMITSFNQIYNFLSHFNQNKLTKNTKIYLTIFSDHIPDKLILEFTKYIENFTKVEILDLRRKSLRTWKFKIRFFRIIFYYFFILKKIILLKKTSIISYIIVSGRMQFPVLFFLNYFSEAKIFFIEDGVGEYVPYLRSEKKIILFFLLNSFCKKNNSRIFILQLAKNRNNYRRILNQKFLPNKNFLNNSEVYLNFMKKVSNEKRLFKPKCLIIGTVPSIYNSLDYIKNLNIKTLLEINKRYHYDADQIVFFPHPRTQLSDYEELVKALSKYSIVHKPTSTIVENYLSQENIELIVGGLSTGLFYAKTIYKKENVFYLEHNHLLKNNNIKKRKNALNVFENFGIKNFFKLNYE